MKIHLDRLPNGKCFIEIEAIDRENNFTDEELKRQCMEIKSKLLIPDKYMMRTGYME